MPDGRIMLETFSPIYKQAQVRVRHATRGGVIEEVEVEAGQLFPRLTACSLTMHDHASVPGRDLA